VAVLPEAVGGLALALVVIGRLLLGNLLAVGQPLKVN
jgi:ABC-type sulfate transport system permease component